MRKWGGTDLLGLTAVAARPLRRSAWSPAPHSRGSLPSSSGLTGRVLPLHSTVVDRWSSLCCPKMSHLPTATAANFCLRFVISFGHKLACVFPSFDKSKPRVVGPLSVPGNTATKLGLQLQGKVGCPAPSLLPSPTILPCVFRPAPRRRRSPNFRCGRPKKTLYWPACVCFSFLSGAAIPTFTNPAWQGSSSGDVSRHNTTRRARARARTYASEPNKSISLFFLIHFFLLCSKEVYKNPNIIRGNNYK